MATAHRAVLWGPIAAAVVLAVGACDGTAIKPSGLYLQFTTSHFTFHHAAADRSLVEVIGPLVESEQPRIVEDLGAEGMRRVQVYFYETFDELAAAVASAVGPIPSWATGLVTSADRMHLLTPRAIGQTTAQAARVVVHEFAHCATLHVNPAAGNNPRWLWEAVALYEARQFVDPHQLAYLTSGAPPTLAELKVLDDRRIYDVGYLLAEFVVARWDWSGLRALVRSSGNLEQALGLAAAQFEAEWMGFVRGRYGL
jgi:hypothetical protein